MTDIDEKKLDALLEELPCQCNDGTYRPKPCKFCRLEEAIAALRRELGAKNALALQYRNTIEALHSALSEAQRSRQVTREQIKLAAENMVYDIEAGVSDYDVAAMMAKSFGLEIVEDKPKGRECGCDWIKPDGKIACERQYAKPVDRRCTLTEGERDEIQ